MSDERANVTQSGCVSPFQESPEMQHCTKVSPPAPGRGPWSHRAMTVCVQACQPFPPCAVFRVSTLASKLGARHSQSEFSSVTGHRAAATAVKAQMAETPHGGSTAVGHRGELTVQIRPSAQLALRGAHWRLPCHSCCSPLSSRVPTRQEYKSSCTGGLATKTNLVNGALNLLKLGARGHFTTTKSELVATSYSFQVTKAYR